MDTGDNASPHNAQVMDQARYWWAVMGQDGEVADNLTAFSTWLDADDSHLAAFEQVCAETASRRRNPARCLTPRWRRMLLPFAVAAILLAVVTVFQSRPDVHVPAAQWQSVAAADGSALDFGPGTRAWLDYDDRVRRIRLESGSVIIEAAKDANRPMIIETAHGSVRVVGTRFTVIVGEAETEVTVTRGRVETRAVGHSDMMAALTAFQRVRLSAAGVRRVDGVVANPEEIRGGWRTLKGEPLSELLTALGNETGHTIVALPSAIRQSGAISGRFFLRDAGATLALLQDAYGLRRGDGPLGLTILY